MSHHTVVDVEQLEYGQSQQYADSVFRSIIRVKAHGRQKDLFTPWSISKDEAKQLARMFVYPFEDNPQWFDPQLVRLRSLRPNKDGRSSVWEVMITRRCPEVGPN